MTKSLREFTPQNLGLATDIHENLLIKNLSDLFKSPFFFFKFILENLNFLPRFLYFFLDFWHSKAMGTLKFEILYFSCLSGTFFKKKHSNNCVFDFFWSNILSNNVRNPPNRSLHFQNGNHSGNQVKACLRKYENWKCDLFLFNFYFVSFETPGYTISTP